MKKNEIGNTAETKRNTAETKQYVVKTNGYQETFLNSQDAKNQYDYLKKRSVKNQEAIKLELTEIDGKSGKKVLESVSIGEDFFG